MDGSPVERTPLSIWSEGSRLAAEIFKPDATGAPAPAILLCHGWGGLKSHLTRYAEVFARRGYVALTFDYRGWGESDGKVIPLADTPMLTTAGEQTLRVCVLREIVDPIDQTTDVKNCLAYLATEEGVDVSRIGLWGSSYGAGHVVFTAGADDRVKAVVAQIGGYGFPPQYRDAARRRQADRARGLIDPPVPQHGLDAIPGLKGTPDIARMVEHFPLRAAEQVRAPTLIIDAEFEELNDRHHHGEEAYKIIQRHAPSAYRTFPGKHYDVYDEFFQPSVHLALDWFDKYLGQHDKEPAR
jgi:dienelactone hydrolase